MDVKKLRIGYFPGSPLFTAPCDRRRFVHYARHKDLRIEIADPQQRYDLVVLSQRADLSVWSRYRPGDAKVVYDANDSYLAIPSTDWKQPLRGLSKYLTGQSRRLQISYTEAIKEMCRRADAVVCSTEEQKSSILPYCNNVHLVLDIHDQEVGSVKTQYASGKTFNFVWEGLASSGIPMALFRDILRPIAKTRDVALHLVTDLVYHRYHDLFVRRYTSDDVTKEFEEIAKHVYVYQWNAFVLSKVATAADMALIPIDLENAFHRGKPENKLLYFWRMGIPTMTSATPAYQRAMRLAGFDMSCGTPTDWGTKLAHYMGDQIAREHAGRQGLQIASTLFSEGEMLRRWDDVIASLFGPNIDSSGASHAGRDERCILSSNIQ